MYRKIIFYGISTVPSSPIPIKHKFNKSKVKIFFAHAKTGLIAKNGLPLNNFEISNDGKRFFRAKDKIKGNKVIISHEKINNPTVVRYGWANNPRRANLYSKAGLPASPFKVKK